MQNLYYRDERQIEYGPASRMQLQELLWAKEISDLGEVRSEGSDEWLPILSLLHDPIPPPCPPIEQHPPHDTLVSTSVENIRWKPPLTIDQFGVAIAVTIGVSVALFLLVKSPTKEGKQPTTHASTQQDDNRLPALRDPPSAIIGRFGLPDIDDSTAYDNPRPPMVTRILTYSKAHVKALYLADAKIEDPPPYKGWLLIGFTDGESEPQAISASEAVRRLKASR